MKILFCFSGVDQQLCLAHGIHLGVVDVYYAEENKEEEQLQLEMEDEDNSDSEDEFDEIEENSNSDDENDGPEVMVTDGENIPEFNESIKNLILRLRKSANILNKSPVKQAQLQEQIKKWQRENEMKIEPMVS